MRADLIREIRGEVFLVAAYLHADGQLPSSHPSTLVARKVQEGEQGERARNSGLVPRQTWR